MATALKLRSDIKKLKKGLEAKGVSASVKEKLKSQLKKAENELESLKKTGKAPKKSSVAGTKVALTALQKLIQRKKYGVYQGAGVDLKKDAGEGALATGRRESKGLKANQFSGKGNAKANKGNVYYEYRPNRLDVKQPKKKQSYPKLEDGGYMAEGGQVVNYRIVPYKRLEVANSPDLLEPYYSLAFTVSGSLSEANEAAQKYVKANDNIVSATVTKIHPSGQPLKNKKVSYVTKDEIQKFEDGGMMAKGGKLEAGVYRVGKPNKVSPNLYEQKIVEIFENGDIATASDYGRKLTDFKVQSYPIITTEQLEAQYKMEKGGYMAKGGETVPYIIWVSKDGEKREFYGDYKSQRAAEMAMRKLWDSSDYKAMGNKPKKMYEKEGFYAKGGGVYSSDSLYILTISKDGKEVGEERFRAKNAKEAKEMGEDYEDEYNSKFGGDLSFNVKEAESKMASGGYMAEGGEVKVGDILTASTGVKVKVIEYDPKFGGRVRVERMDEYATGKPSQFMPLSKFKMASGGYMAEGGALEHGLMVGDVVKGIQGNGIAIYNEKTKGSFIVDISKGSRMKMSNMEFNKYSHGGNVTSTTHRMSN